MTKMSILPNAIHAVNAIPIKIAIANFTSRTNISKMNMEPKKTPSSLSNLEKEEQSRRGHNI